MVYIGLRVLGAYWGGLEMRVVPATPAPLSVRVLRWCWRLEVAAAFGVASAQSLLSHFVGQNASGGWTLTIAAGHWRGLCRGSV